MTLREMAEQAADTIEQAIGTNGQRDWIVQEVERVAREFAERALACAVAMANEREDEVPFAEAIAAAERGGK